MVQPRDGGLDTYDNCIPLCLDCHAEVGHYTDTHPKGTKFTPDELRLHRDRWYRKIDTGISEGAPGDHLGLDLRLFRRLVALLGGSHKMLHFRDHDYGANYSVAVEESLYAFLRTVELPEAEFFDLEMEAALADLRGVILSYTEACTNRVWWNGDGTAGVPSEWCSGEPEVEKRFWDAVKVMNEKATPIWESYCQFVRAGRLRLKADMNVEPSAAPNGGPATCPGSSEVKEGPSSAI